MNEPKEIRERVRCVFGNSSIFSLDEFRTEDDGSLGSGFGEVSNSNSKHSFRTDGRGPPAVFLPTRLAGGHRAPNENLNYGCVSKRTSQSTYFCAIGMRRPSPKARLVTFNPGAACSRLYSLRSTRRWTQRTVFSSNPRPMISRALKLSST